MRLSEPAPAKVNLFLHVGGPGPDGRHPVCSWAVFADVGDQIEAESASAHALSVGGRFAQAVGADADNLIARALQAAGAPPMSVRLDKRLPVASGLGGGSSDAGAALRLARRLFPDLAEADVQRAAQSIGADGPLCLAARSSIAEGEGERLSEAPDMPPLHAVLMNPGVASPTGAVYRAYDEGDGAFSADRPAMPARFSCVGEVVGFLKGTRNDLEAPARRLTPEIGDALDAMTGAPGVLFTRMSGSGATVFGLFENAASAAQAAGRLNAVRPGWWVQACVLGGGRQTCLKCGEAGAQGLI